jgi:hypothetical protein
MEAVFDRVATAIRIENLGRVVAEEEPDAALDALVQTFCNFWREAAVMRLQDAVGSDPEFDQALLSRHERRRALLKTLVRRLAADADTRLKGDVVDTVFALTSPQMYRLLCQGRSAKAASLLVRQSCMEALGRLTPSRAKKIR